MQVRKSRWMAIAAIVLGVSVFRSCSDSSQDVGFRLFDPATGLPVASVSMPEGWILGGKSMWTQGGGVREHFCYLFARSADGRHTMFANPVYSYTPHLALNISLMEKLDWESEYVQDPTHFGWHVAPKLAETYGLDVLTLVSAEIEDETPPDWMLSLWGNPSRYRYGTLRLAYAGQCRCGGHHGDDGDEDEISEHQGPTVVCAEAKWFSVDMSTGMPMVSLTNFASVYSPFDLEEGVGYMRQFVKSLYYSPEIVRYVNSVTTQDTQAFIRSQNERHEEAMRRAAGESARQDARVDAFCNYLKDEQLVVNPGDGKVYSVDSRYDTTMMSSDGTMIQFNKSDMAPDFSPEQGVTIGHREFRLTSAYQDPRRN